jgi:hypothetical protein
MQKPGREHVQMPLTQKKKITLALSVAAVLITGALLGRYFSPNSDASERQQLLRLIPSDSTAVIFLDLDQFRNSPFLVKLYSWAPHPAEDSEYAQFVRDTGFSYERDLKKAVVAISNNGATTSKLAIADGKFDRKKIEAFLTRSAQPTQQGKWKIFHVQATSHDPPLSLVFLSDQRLGITDSASFPETLASAAGETRHADWDTHFDRLAGTPLFAVIRQDPSMQNAFNSATPGGFRSPQLSALLNQLQWISIAGKPEGDQLRVVTEGECLSEPATAQLRDFLQGILMLAQNGLNDPKLRQQMNPDEREAYLEILKSADVQKINRGEWKSVRVVLEITPKFLDAAHVNSITAPAADTPASPEIPKRHAASGKANTRKKK